MHLLALNEEIVGDGFIVVHPQRLHVVTDVTGTPSQHDSFGAYGRE